MKKIILSIIFGMPAFAAEPINGVWNFKTQECSQGHSNVEVLPHHQLLIIMPNFQFHQNPIKGELSDEAFDSYGTIAMNEEARELAMISHSSSSDQPDFAQFRYEVKGETLKLTGDGENFCDEGKTVTFVYEKE